MISPAVFKELGRIPKQLMTAVKLAYEGKHVMLVVPNQKVEQYCVGMLNAIVPPERSEKSTSRYNYGRGVLQLATVKKAVAQKQIVMTLDEAKAINLEDFEKLREYSRKPYRKN